MLNKIIILLVILVSILIFFKYTQSTENFQTDNDILSILEKTGNINTANPQDKRELYLKDDILDKNVDMVKASSSVSSKIVNDDVLKEFVIKQLGPRTGDNSDNYMLEGDNKRSSGTFNTTIDLDKVIRKNRHKIFSKITNQNMTLKNIKLELLKLINSNIDPAILRKRKQCLNKK
jgi:hypothetical protein